jgi:hypothetical protein
MKKLIKSAESVPDFRRPWGHILHRLSDILVISFCAIICGAETYNDLEVFGKAKEVWLSNYLSLPNGIPNADTFERIFEMLDPTIVAKKLRWFLQSEEIAGKIIAFDGKTMRGSKSEDNRGFHVLSAFLTDDQIVLGEITCDEKSNDSPRNFVRLKNPAHLFRDNTGVNHLKNTFKSIGVRNAVR